MNRTPNVTCKVCKKPTYKRPFEIESYGVNLYCCRKCMFDDRKVFAKCPICSNDFQVKKPTQIYCSKRCVGKTTRNNSGTKKGFRKQKSVSLDRFNELKAAHNFQSCMVRGCTYNKCYDIHRLVEGKNGGKYEIGNMFAICPNHHAEHHRNIITLVKVSDFELEIRQ